MAVRSWLISLILMSMHQARLSHHVIRVASIICGIVRMGYCVFEGRGIIGTGVVSDSVEESATVRLLMVVDDVTVAVGMMSSVTQKSLAL